MLKWIEHFFSRLPLCLFTYSFIMYSPCLNQLSARRIEKCTKLDKIYQDVPLSQWGKSRYLNRFRILLTRRRKGEGKWLLRRQPKASIITADWTITKAAQHKWFFSIIQSICNAIFKYSLWFYFLCIFYLARIIQNSKEKYQIKRLAYPHFVSYFYEPSRQAKYRIYFLKTCFFKYLNKFRYSSITHIFCNNSTMTIVNLHIW